MRLRIPIALALLAATVACAGPGRLDRNKAVARQLFEEVLNRGRWDVSERIHAPDFVAHAGKTAASLSEDLAWSKGWREAFPDLAVTVDQVVGEGDLVAVRWTARGTNTGTGNGLPATGKRIESGGIVIFRFADGRIAEEWTVAEELSLLRQLDLLPKRSR